MGKTIRDHLVDILDELTGAEMKRFKAKLNQVPVKEGYSNIPKGKLEKAESDDIADLLISFYTDTYAPEVVCTVLDEINMKHLCLQLSKAVGRPDPEGQAASSSSEGQKTAGAEAGADDVHFVDKYRNDIIQRLTVPESVLDILHGKDLLRDEPYDRIRAMSTSQDKMRELYTVARAWGKSGKDEFYKALEKEHPYLVKDLKGQ